MKLAVHRNGVKLFFLTFAMEGRRPLLSQLLPGKRRPQLLPLGECVQAGLLAIHKVYPAAGISDFVIMPDHVHFLLVVDYRRMPAFNPLWVVHRLMDAVEMAWNGRGPAPAPPDMVAFLNQAVRHGHAFAAAIKDSSPSGVRGASSPSGGVRGASIGGVRGGSSPSGGVRGGSPDRSILFERSPYIELAFDPRQLKAIRHYIRLNPARALWRQQHPELFVRRALAWEKARPYMLSRQFPFRLPPVFHAMGNVPLLGSPFLFHVRLTLKKPLPEHLPAIEEILDKARHGMIPVSGFISPGEKEALRRLKLEPRARFIKLLPHALPPQYDPSAEDSRELAAGRLLIMGTFPEVAPPTSLEMRKNPAAAHAFRRACLAMNDFAAALCEGG